LPNPDADALHGSATQTDPSDIVARIDQLLELGDDDFVAQSLNAAGIRNWRNCCFAKGYITNVRKGRNLRSHHERRNASGYATAGELAARHNVTRTTIRHWAKNGLLERFSCGHRHRWYYRAFHWERILSKGTAVPTPSRRESSRRPPAARPNTEQSDKHAKI
jgi:hypothetical protein